MKNLGIFFKYFASRGLGKNLEKSTFGEFFMKKILINVWNPLFFKSLWGIFFFRIIELKTFFKKILIKSTFGAVGFLKIRFWRLWKNSFLFWRYYTISLNNLQLETLFVKHFFAKTTFGNLENLIKIHFWRLRKISLQKLHLETLL